MLAQKLLLPTLALLGAAAAAKSDTQPSICSQATATITNTAQAQAYTACTTVSGTLVIDSSAVGTIDISGPTEITGDLVAQSAPGLTEISSSTIQSIGGTFNLFNVTGLNFLSFTNLTSVSSLVWNIVPNFISVTFPQEISKANSIDIEDTTLKTLDGINLDTVDTFTVINNRFLTSISTQVSSVGSIMNIASNGIGLTVDLPNLVWAANATFRNTSSVMIPSLTTINGTLTFDENLFSDLSAPNLTAIGTSGGSLTLAGNPSLTNFSFPLLKSIAGANNIANNSALMNISFPSLTSVGGAIFFTGNFTTPNLPVLTSVVGGFTLESTQNIDCSVYQNEAGANKVIQGTVTCDSADSNPNPVVSGSGTSTSTGASSTASKKSAADAFGVNEAVAGLSVVGGLLQMLL